MIKGKPPYPFETIALVVDFSPRLDALIAETKRLSKLFNSKTVFIHAGKRTSEKEMLLSNKLLNNEFNDSNCNVHWQDGNQTEIVLAVCKDYVVDLLILDSVVNDPYNSNKASISIEVSRKAKCSFLILVNPLPEPKPFNKIVVRGHDHVKTIHTIKTALYFADREGVSEITLLDEPDGNALATYSNEEIIGLKRTHTNQPIAFADNEIATSELPVEEFTRVAIQVDTITRSDNGVAKYAKKNGADLLVVNSHDHHLAIFDRIFSNDLENLLADLPCNMLIVHSRVY